MAIQSAKEREQAIKVIEKATSLDCPTPMKPDDQRRFQRSCLEEARRLQRLLAKRLTRRVRTDIEKWALIFCAFGTKPTLTVGNARLLSPFFYTSLTSYKNKYAQSYKKKPKG